VFFRSMFCSIELLQLPYKHLQKQLFGDRGFGVILGGNKSIEALFDRKYFGFIESISSL
jgi:hypothetical protein